MTKKENPFLNLDEAEIDKAQSSLQCQLVEFTSQSDIQDQLGEAFYIWKNDPELLVEDFEDDIDETTFSKFFDWFIYDFKLINYEKRVIELFKEREGPSLPTIEGLMLDSWTASLLSYFEVEDVAAGNWSKIRDIFTGENFQVHDRASSKHIRHSDIISARTLITGNQCYFSGVVSIYPHNFKSLILRYFLKEFEEYKKAFGKERDLRDYIRDWGYLIGHYLEEIINDPHYITPDGEELKFVAARYKITDRNEVVKILQTENSLSELPGGSKDLNVFSWAGQGAEHFMGTIEVEKTKFVIQCNSNKSLSAARTVFESNLGELIKFEKRYINKASFHVNKKVKNKPQKRLKPPPGVNTKREMNTILDQYYKSWLDAPHDALSGQTPRESLETTEGKQKLIKLIKELKDFYSRAKERGEPYYDVYKLFKELRLEEH
ncbi:MAG: hypothetical protein V3U74_04665 [Thermodesulfobacteriota bacterium]